MAARATKSGSSSRRGGTSRTTSRSPSARGRSSNTGSRSYSASGRGSSRSEGRDERRDDYGGGFRDEQQWQGRGGGQYSGASRYDESRSTGRSQYGSSRDMYQGDYETPRRSERYYDDESYGRRDDMDRGSERGGRRMSQGRYTQGGYQNEGYGAERSERGGRGDYQRGSSTRSYQSQSRPWYEDEDMYDESEFDENESRRARSNDRDEDFDEDFDDRRSRQQHHYR